MTCKWCKQEFYWSEEYKVHVLFQCPGTKSDFYSGGINQMKTRKAEKGCAHPNNECLQPSHTPTPWNYTFSNADGTMITDDDGKSIAVIPVDGGTPENVANAACIVQAVNAHEELMGTIYKISSLLQAMRDDKKAIALCDMIETLVCDAIAKAEGK